MLRMFVANYLSDSRLACDSRLATRTGLGTRPARQTGEDVPRRTSLNCAKRVLMPRAPAGGAREAMLLEVVICREGIQRATTAAVVAVWLGVGESDVAWTTGRGALGSGERGDGGL